MTKCLSILSLLQMTISSIRQGYFLTISAATLLVFYPFRESLTLGDKDPVLSDSNLSRLIPPLLQSPVSSVFYSFRLLIGEEIFGIQWVIVITHWIHRLLLWLRCHSLSSASLSDDPFFVGSPWASWRRLTEGLCIQWLVKRSCLI